MMETHRESLRKALLESMKKSKPEGMVNNQTAGCRNVKMTDNIENLEQEENVKDKKMAEYIEEIEEGELEDEEEKIVYSKSIHPNSKENVETAEVISIESSEEGELRVEVEDGEIQEDSEPEWDAVKVGTIDVVKFKLINEKQNVHNSEVGERGWYEKEIDRIKQTDGVHPIKQAKEHFRRKNLREKLLRMKKEKERIQGGGKKLDLVQDSRPFMAEISERNGNVDITGERIDEFLKGVVENNVEEERSELEDSSEVDMEMSDDSAGNEEIDNKIIVQRNKLNSQEIMKRIEAMRKTKEMSSKLIVEFSDTSEEGEDEEDEVVDKEMTGETESGSFGGLEEIEATTDNKMRENLNRIKRQRREFINECYKLYKRTKIKADGRMKYIDTSGQVQTKHHDPINGKEIEVQTLDDEVLRQMLNKVLKRNEERLNELKIEYERRIKCIETRKQLLKKIEREEIQETTVGAEISIASGFNTPKNDQDKELDETVVMKRLKEVKDIDVIKNEMREKSGKAELFIKEQLVKRKTEENNQLKKIRGEIEMEIDILNKRLRETVGQIERNEEEIEEAKERIRELDTKNKINTAICVEFLNLVIETLKNGKKTEMQMGFKEVEIMGQEGLVAEDAYDYLMRRGESVAKSSSASVYIQPDTQYAALHNKVYNLQKYRRYQSPISPMLRMKLLGKSTFRIPEARSDGKVRKLEKKKMMCEYELSGGMCNDDSCQSMHAEDYSTDKNPINAVLSLVAGLPVNEASLSECLRHYIGIKNAIESIEPKYVEPAILVSTLLEKCWRNNAINNTSVECNNRDSGGAETSLDDSIKKKIQEFRNVLEKNLEMNRFGGYMRFNDERMGGKKRGKSNTKSNVFEIPFTSRRLIDILNESRKSQSDMYKQKPINKRYFESENEIEQDEEALENQQEEKEGKKDIESNEKSYKELLGKISNKLRPLTLKDFMNGTEKRIIKAICQLEVEMEKRGFGNKEEEEVKRFENETERYEMNIEGEVEMDIEDEKVDIYTEMIFRSKKHAKALGGGGGEGNRNGLELFENIVKSRKYQTNIIIMMRYFYNGVICFYNTSRLEQGKNVKTKSKELLHVCKMAVRYLALYNKIDFTHLNNTSCNGSGSGSGSGSGDIDGYSFAGLLRPFQVVLIVWKLHVDFVMTSLKDNNIKKSSNSTGKGQYYKDSVTDMYMMVLLSWFKTFLRCNTIEQLINCTRNSIAGQLYRLYNAHIEKDIDEDDNRKIAEYSELKIYTDENSEFDEENKSGGKPDGGLMKIDDGVVIDFNNLEIESIGNKQEENGGENGLGFRKHEKKKKMGKFKKTITLGDLTTFNFIALFENLDSTSMTVIDKVMMYQVYLYILLNKELGKNYMIDNKKENKTSGNDTSLYDFVTSGIFFYLKIYQLDETALSNSIVTEVIDYQFDQYLQQFQQLQSQFSLLPSVIKNKSKNKHKNKGNSTNITREKSTGLEATIENNNGGGSEAGMALLLSVILGMMNYKDGKKNKPMKIKSSNDNVVGDIFIDYGQQDIKSVIVEDDDNYFLIPKSMEICGVKIKGKVLVMMYLHSPYFMTRLLVNYNCKVLVRLINVLGLMIVLSLSNQANSNDGDDDIANNKIGNDRISVIEKALVLGIMALFQNANSGLNDFTDSSMVGSRDEREYSSTNHDGYQLEWKKRLLRLLFSIINLKDSKRKDESSSLSNLNSISTNAVNTNVSEKTSLENSKVATNKKSKKLQTIIQNNLSHIIAVLPTNPDDFTQYEKIRWLGSNEQDESSENTHLEKQEQGKRCCDCDCDECVIDYILEQKKENMLILVILLSICNDDNDDGKLDESQTCKVKSIISRIFMDGKDDNGNRQPCNFELKYKEFLAGDNGNNNDNTRISKQRSEFYKLMGSNKVFKRGWYS